MNDGIQSVLDKIMQQLHMLVLQLVWHQVLTQFPDQFLDILSLLIVTHCYRNTVRPRSRRPSNPMQISLGFGRETEIQDSFDCADIQATSN